MKCDEAIFWEKSLFSPKWGKWVIFGPEIKIFELFFKSVHYIFLKLCLMPDIKKWVKIVVLDF